MNTQHTHKIRALLCLLLLFSIRFNSFASIFIQNNGQLLDTEGNPASEVLYYAQLPEYDFFLLPDRLVYTWRTVDENDAIIFDKLELKIAEADFEEITGLHKLNGGLKWISDRGTFESNEFQGLQITNTNNGLITQIGIENDQIGFVFKADSYLSLDEVQLEVLTSDAEVTTSIDGGLEISTQFGNNVQFNPCDESGKFSFNPSEEGKKIIDLELIGEIDFENLQKPAFVINLPCRNEFFPSSFVGLINGDDNWSTYYGGTGNDIMGKVAVDEVTGDYAVLTYTDNYIEYPQTKGIGVNITDLRKTVHYPSVVMFDREKERLFDITFQTEENSYFTDLDFSSSGQELYICGNTTDRKFPIFNALAGDEVYERNDYSRGTGTTNATNGFVMRLLLDRLVGNNTNPDWMAYVGKVELTGICVSSHDQDTKVTVVGNRANFEHDENESPVNVGFDLPIVSPNTDATVIDYDGEDGKTPFGYLAHFSNHALEWATLIGPVGIPDDVNFITDVDALSKFTISLTSSTGLLISGQTNANGTVACDITTNNLQNIQVCNNHETDIPFELNEAGIFAYGFDLENYQLFWSTKNPLIKITKSLSEGLTKSIETIDVDRSGFIMCGHSESNQLNQLGYTQNSFLGGNSDGVLLKYYHNANNVKGYALRDGWYIGGPTDDYIHSCDFTVGFSSILSSSTNNEFSYPAAGSEHGYDFNSESAGNQDFFLSLFYHEHPWYSTFIGTNEFDYASDIVMNYREFEPDDTWEVFISGNGSGEGFPVSKGGNPLAYIQSKS